MLKLNRTGNALNRDTRNKDNENWAKLEKKYNNVVGEITEEVFDKIVDGSKIDWSQMVDTVADLPSGAKIGETRGVKEDNKIYRFGGSDWIPIAEINLNPIAEVDDRLSSQLAETEEQIFYNSTISHKEPTFMVTIIDDDGHRGFYTKYFELAKEYNIPITSAMITGKPMGFPWDSRPYNNKYYHYDEIMEMHNSGLIEFVSHSHTHPAPITEVSDEDLYEDYKKSREELKRLGLNYRALVQPGGNYDKRIFDITRSLFDYGFRGRNRSGSSVTTPPLDNIGIHRLSIEQHDFEDIIKPEIDAAKDLNGWLVFVGHVDQDYGWSESKVRQVIEYVQSQGGKFVTTQEGINHHGNILQVGDISISADGRVFGDSLGRVVVDDRNTITNESSIDEFELGKITITYLRRTQVETGFPDMGIGSSGVLTTYRLHDREWYWNYQTFRRTNETQQFFRYLNTDGTWGEWQEESLYRIMPKPNAYTGQTKISEFPVGVTTFRVQGGQHPEGLPEGHGGTFKTVKPHDTEYGWAYQEFVQYVTTDKYIRSGQDNGNWSAWRKILMERV